MDNIITQTKRVGGSIMVRIPKEIVQSERILENELIEIDVRKVKKDYFGCMPTLKPFSRQDRMRGRYD